MAFSATRMLMAAAGVSVTPPVTTGASVFTASSTSSNLKITGSITAAGTGIFSCWVNFAAFQGANNSIWFNSRGSGVSIVMGSSGLLTVSLANGGSGSFVVRDQNSISTGTWYNLLCSWNTNFASGSKIFNMYINGSARTYDTLSDSAAYNNNNYNPPFYIGPSDLAASDSLNACATEVYFAPGQFLDFTNPSNVALFYAGGTPANLGSNGQTPTGSAPAVYWHGVYNNLTNLGTLGGSFTASGDALTACGSYPAYTANASNFNYGSSTSTQMTISGSSLSTYSTGTFSGWVNLTAYSPSVFTNVIREGVNLVINVRIGTSGNITVKITDGGSNSLQIVSNTALSLSTWYNILCSWNSSTGVMTLYINNVADSATPTFTGAFSTNWSSTTYQISGLYVSDISINGCLSEIYLAGNQFIDFTNSSNRAKFISGGNPVFLGSSGSLPTGTSPSFYWPALYSNLSNQGAVGGTFTVSNGPLTACGSAP